MQSPGSKINWNHSSNIEEWPSQGTLESITFSRSIRIVSRFFIIAVWDMIKFEGNNILWSAQLFRSHVEKGWLNDSRLCWSVCHAWSWTQNSFLTSTVAHKLFTLQCRCWDWGCCGRCMDIWVPVRLYFHVFQCTYFVYYFWWCDL